MQGLYAVKGEDSDRVSPRVVVWAGITVLGVDHGGGDLRLEKGPRPPQQRTLLLAIRLIFTEDRKVGDDIRTIVTKRGTHCGVMSIRGG